MVSTTNTTMALMAAVRLESVSVETNSASEIVQSSAARMSRLASTMRSRPAPMPMVVPDSVASGWMPNTAQPASSPPMPTRSMPTTT